MNYTRECAVVKTDLFRQALTARDEMDVARHLDLMDMFVQLNEHDLADALSKAFDEHVKHIGDCESTQNSAFKEAQGYGYPLFA